MVLCNLSPISPTLSNNTKVLALESTLQQCVFNFRELLSDYEQLQRENENNKTQYLSVKSKCESKSCPGSEELKKMYADKEKIIESVASSLTKLNDTKDWNVLTEIFKILFKDTSSSEKPASIINKLKNSENNPNNENNTTQVSPKNENVSITEDISFNEESLSEIEGTPGRTSPIIQTKKTKSFADRSSDMRDKKKCPTNWPTPEPKTLKLQYLTPSRSKTGKLRQSRINIAKLKQTAVVDLTCSPELSGGRSGEEKVMPLIKKESVENDDTILPSPTSGPTSFTQLKTTFKDSQSKFKRPLSLKPKTEKCENSSKHDENRNHTNIEKEITAMEDSINILNPLVNRFNGINKEKQINFENTKQIKLENNSMQTDEDTTHCDTNSSISLLDHVNKLDGEHKSPKRPLEENINIVNTPPKEANLQSSLSLLQPENRMVIDKVKRKLPELVEPIYKEPTVRNKQEKRNLQGWSCEQCKNFYGDLYEDDPIMLAKKIHECSKHRGRHNPERPKTPPNFWNPRWHVPEDTEEFNRMNNAN